MMATKTKQQDMPAEKPLTIIVTVLPPKRGLRTMIVSAAREGEMPLVLGGPFADRHHLLDQAYAAVLKREPQVVTIAEPKAGKSKSITADVEEEEPGNRDPDEDAENSDQMVPAESVPVSIIIGTEETDELPAIEGDDVETLRATSEGEEASDG